MKLKMVAQADFRKNENSHWNEQLVTCPALRRMETGECVLFISKSEKQLRFVFRPSTVTGTSKRTPLAEVIESRMLRIRGGGRWNPLMLANYGTEAGLELDGIKRFETFYSELVS